MNAIRISSESRRHRLTSLALALVAVALVLAIAGDAAACPTCKDGVAESDPEGANVARGYFYSILIMLAMPFTLAGTFGAYVWREMRRQERERLAAGTSVPAPLGALPAPADGGPACPTRGA